MCVSISPSPSLTICAKSSLMAMRGRPDESVKPSRSNTMANSPLAPDKGRGWGGGRCYRVLESAIRG